MKKNARNIVYMIAAAGTVAACGGGGTPPPPVSVPATATVTPPTPPVSSACSLRSRQDWAAAQIREWYLFPETLPATADPSGFTTVSAYIDALTATARGQGRDRFFTFITSIEQENAFFQTGSSAGLGIRLNYDIANGRVFVAEAFEGAPALAAGIDRGTEILAIGTSASNLSNVSVILGSQGAAGVSQALGPNTPGTTRFLQIRNAAGTSTVSVAKAEFNIQPVSSRYGATIINDGGKQIAYINMRTFISTADAQLRSAFANYRAQGITDFIIDFRYNGGGLVSTAELMTNLLGGARSNRDILSRTTFRVEKNNNDRTEFFTPQSQSVGALKIAFIGTGSTASASELVMNSFTPYIGVNAALVGSDTFGKPVGQIALDQASCDDRLRVVAFSTQNSANRGFYYNGIASVMGTTCQASDDLTRPLGDPAEESVARAIDFIQGRSCTAISSAASAKTQAKISGGKRISSQMLTPDAPTPAQREVPGLF
ncbi:S41 family peptidase [Sphingorhabdus arenilitoris]|uniref:S41 family peptidase n=1 Tax=Sphingorhabdus arenilitoris TaxID=1490041 RepID=A0ABV8RI58_9SPHN